jgi:non-ribosomal peptide synthetase component F
MLEDARPAVLITVESLARSLPSHQAGVVRMDADWPIIAAEPEENPAGATLAHNAAYVIYTSGSTGQPKGAINTHEGIRNRLLWMQDAYRLTDADRVLQMFRSGNSSGP